MRTELPPGDPWRGRSGSTRGTTKSKVVYPVNGRRTHGECQTKDEQDNCLTYIPLYLVSLNHAGQATWHRAVRVAITLDLRATAAYCGMASGAVSDCGTARWTCQCMANSTLPHGRPGTPGSLRAPTGVLTPLTPPAESL